MKTELLASCLLRLAAPGKHHPLKLLSPKSGLLLESIWHQRKTKFQIKSAIRHTTNLTPHHHL